MYAGMRTSRPTTRRSFLAHCGYGLTLAAAACELPTVANTPDAVTLHSRPAGIPRNAKPGLRPIGADWVRDGSLYIPASYKADVPSPLIVLMHGAGQDDQGWWASGNLIKDADEFGFIVLTPESRGGSWDLLTLGGFGPDVEFIDRALEITFATCNVDASRIAFGGFSDGASYALSLGISNGTLFSGLIAFSPGVLSPVWRVGTPRVFISHGRNDAILPFAGARQIAATLETAGYDVEFVEFNGGHEVGRERTRLAYEWFLPSSEPVPV